MSTISAKNISISYGDTLVIKNLSFEISKGDKVAVTGVSGGGKSTLINFLMGFVPDFEGEISIFGYPLSKESIYHIRQHTAWLPQDLSIPFETVEEMVFAPFEFHINQENKPSIEEVHTLFKEFLLPLDLLKKKATEISGGQRQRVLLIGSILLKKEILFLDEPVSALDAISRKQVTDYILSLENLTVVSAIHDDYWANKSNKIIEV